MSKKGCIRQDDKSTPHWSKCNDARKVPLLSSGDLHMHKQNHIWSGELLQLLSVTSHEAFGRLLTFTIWSLTTI